jgi:hypothetical protein
MSKDDYWNKLIKEYGNIISDGDKVLEEKKN